MGKLKDLAYTLADLESGINYLEDAKECLKADIRLFVIGTLVLGAICISIMYLRFRVFGG